MPTHYDVLGIAPSAAPDSIRRAYHQQARAWHPDRFVNRDDAEAEKAEEAMREVNEAFRILGNDERRATYDAGLATGLNGDRQVRVDDGITRIDPRLLDPEYLHRRRMQQEAALTAHHSRMMSVIPWAGFLGILLLIFVFTAYATRSEPPPPAVAPGPDIGLTPNACVRLMEGPSLVEVPCTRVNDGRVIGARFVDGVCPPLTRNEMSVTEEVIVCLG